jgi:hypothetical protein
MSVNRVQSIGQTQGTGAVAGACTVSPSSEIERLAEGAVSAQTSSLFDDFCSLDNIAAVVSGTSAAVDSATDPATDPETVFGSFALLSGTDATGRARANWFGTAPANLVGPLNAPSMVFETRFLIDSLGVALDQYYFQTGIFEPVSETDKGVSYGVSLLYDPAVSLNWLITYKFTSAAAVAVDSGIPVSQDVWTKAKITVQGLILSVYVNETVAEDSYQLAAQIDLTPPAGDFPAIIYAKAPILARVVKQSGATGRRVDVDFMRYIAQVASR